MSQNRRKRTRTTIGRCNPTDDTQMGVLVIARLGQRVDGEREGFGEQHERAGAVSGGVRHSDHGGSLWSADGLKSDRLGSPDPAGPQRDGRRLLGLVVVADHADCGATSEHAGSQQCTHCGGDFLDGTDIVATHEKKRDVGCLADRLDDRSDDFAHGKRRVGVFRDRGAERRHVRPPEAEEWCREQ